MRVIDPGLSWTLKYSTVKEHSLVLVGETWYPREVQKHRGVLFGQGNVELQRRRSLIYWRSVLGPWARFDRSWARPWPNNLGLSQDPWGRIYLTPTVWRTWSLVSAGDNSCCRWISTKRNGQSFLLWLSPSQFYHLFTSMLNVTYHIHGGFLTLIFPVCQSSWKFPERMTQSCVSHFGILKPAVLTMMINYYNHLS